jgi:DNA-binding transcriptional regulator YhcF (GntR family)
VAVRFDDDARPAYVQVADVLRDEIKRGAIRPGERLPSVRDLSVRFDIASVTVQSALRVLRDEGFIASRSTRGYFVREELPPADIDQPSAEFTALRNQIDAIQAVMRDLADRVTHLEAAAAGPRQADDRPGSPGPTTGPEH